MKQIKDETKPSKTASKELSNIAQYRKVWRWHFYSGIFVVPFIIMLSLTGLIMLHHDYLEEIQYGNLLSVSQKGEKVSYQKQMEKIKTTYPDSTIKQLIYTTDPENSTKFVITDKSKINKFVYIDPYTNIILGEVIQEDTWYAFANDVHGHFFMGDLGDRLIEIAAGFSIILIITGLYLWWPNRGFSHSGVLFPRFKRGIKGLFKELHITTGLYMAVPLVFFLISGLAWTGIWGEKLVQAWSSFPSEKWENVPVSDITHDKMFNSVGNKEVPWNLEKTPVPVSGSDSGVEYLPNKEKVTVDNLIKYSEQNGFKSNFKLNLPKDEKGVFTITANTMSGDITDPRLDKTLHIDRYSGKILAEISWNDYNLMAKSMAAGIAFHQGDAGSINKILNTLFCLFVLFIAISGVVLWWQRRPSNSMRLYAPPQSKSSKVWVYALVISVMVGILFPLVGITLLGIYLIDLLFVKRIPKLSQFFN